MPITAQGASLNSIASAIGPSEEDRPGEVVLIPLDDQGRVDLESFGDPLRFQYFPETLTDGKQINYQQKEIPGGSLPIYQWVASGERLISFTAVFSTDTDLTSNVEDGVNITGSGSGLQDRNVDIRSAIAWLRSFMNPRYVNGSSGGGGAASTEGLSPGAGGSPTSGFTYMTKPPKRVRLYIPNSGIGVSGGVVSAQVPALPDSVTCVMTQCEVTYQAFFPSGLPRLVEVQLGFAQIPQYGDRVAFPSADTMAKHVNGGAETVFYGYKLRNRRRTTSTPEGR